MIAVLCLQYLLLVLVPGTKTTAQKPAEQDRSAMHHKVFELCELSKSNWYSNPKQAVIFGKEAVELAEQINDQPLLARAYNSTGAGYYNLGDYNTATDFYYKSLKIRENIADTLGLSSSYNNIGNIYLMQRNFTKAHAFYTQSYNLAKAINDTLSISRSLNSLGSLYQEQEQLDSALNLFLRALPLKEKARDNKGTTVSLIHIGLVYQKLGKYDNALHYLQRGLALTIKSNSLHDRIFAYRGLAETYSGLKDYEKAFMYGKYSLEIAQKTNSKSEAKNSAKVLQRLYRESGNYEKAYEYLDLYVAYSDSINTEEITRQTTSFQVKYETAQKEKENLMLLAEHEIHEKEIEQKSIIQYATIILLSLALAVVVLAYRGNRRMKRLNKLLSRKNKKVSKYSESIKRQKNALAAQALKVQQQKEELETLNQLKDKLFSIVAHDLRGPLLSLKSVLHILAMGRIPEEKFLQLAKTLETEQQNSLWLVDNLLLWAKSQMKGIKINPTELNLHQLAQETIDLLTSQAERKKITILNQTTPDALAFADADMVQLILRNLVSNAIKFCNENDTVTIETAITDIDTVKVIVRDTGVGISPEKQEKLFGVKSVTTLGTAKERGSGLGLAMCRDFVELNHGHIWVESVLGEGSTFIFTLPMITEAVPVTNAALQTAELV